MIKGTWGYVYYTTDFVTGGPSTDQISPYIVLNGYVAALIIEYSQTKGPLKKRSKFDLRWIGNERERFEN